MPVRFKAVERPNPRDLNLPKKWYAQVVSGDDVTFDELANLISKVSNLNYGEVLGALGTLIEVIELQLRHGRAVRLHTLGTFYLSFNSSGVETTEELASSNILRTNIRFRPGKRLKRLVSTLDFEKQNDNVNGSTI